ncbi:hypothetical protein DEJ50_26075 [Streptomyces venezuelae]|uniref:Uncharacterized protein n=1 Tax=Streptomyces venezuelae TaxID=54571 RepID=A0A5P2D8B1_STRVZ|nr:hypothetical protein [Streptomyces venezuelae]QES50790.1 hypothetical protein DEJ50_26075 [Streptomyces venezuelae]
MSVHTPSAAGPARPAEGTPRTAVRPTARRHGADTRLTWWALALPTAAFAFLFLLLGSPAGAQPGPDGSTIGHLIALLLRAFG